MKHNVKRILSMTLAILMLASAFAFGTSAASVNKTVTEDFTDVTLDTDFKFNNVWSGTPESTFAAGDDTVTVADGVFSYRTKADARYQINAPASAKGNKLTLTGEVTYTAALVNVAYSRLFVRANGNTLFCSALFHLTPSALQIGFMNDNASAYAAGPLTVYSDTSFVGKTLVFALTRDGANQTFSVWEKDNKDATLKSVSMTMSAENNVSAIPGLRLQSDRTDKGGDPITVKLDNLSVQSTVTTPAPAEDLLPNGWNVLTENFDGAEIGEDMAIKADSCTWTGKVDGNTENNIKIKDGKLSYQTGESARYLIGAPASFSSDCFTFSGDVKLSFCPDVNNTYYRVFFRPIVNEKNLHYAAFIHVTKNSAYLQFIGPDNDVLAGTRTDIPNPTTYLNVIGSVDAPIILSFELVRTGAALQFSVWVKDQYETTACTTSAVMTVEEYINAPSAPLIRLQSPADLTSASNNPTVDFDNFRLENTVSAVSVVGAQVGTKTDSDKYALRFVATVNSREYKEAGFTVVAKNEAGEILRTWEVNTCQAYDAIIGNTEAGTVDYTAPALGGKYLIAVTVRNIPQSIGAVTFEVKAHCTSLDGGMTYVSDLADCTATPASDGTVALS